MPTKYKWIKFPLLVPPRSTSWVPLPGIVISRRRIENVGLLHRCHEEVHLEQIERYGWFGYVFRYLKDLPRYGYSMHPMEIEARTEGFKRYLKHPGLSTEYLLRQDL